MARVLEDARGLGMDAESMSNLAETLQATAPRDDEDGVWPENVAIVEAFYAVSLQWRVTSRGGGGFASPFGGMSAPVVPLYIGLDYTAVRAGLDAEGIVVTPELWRGLRVMENAACKALNESN